MMSEEGRWMSSDLTPYGEGARESDSEIGMGGTLCVSMAT